MDEAVVAFAEMRACVGDKLRELRLPKLARGGRAAVRRLSLSLHIPASLQIELPLTLRHTRRIGPPDIRERLSRDGFAVGIARCMAGARLAPRAVGMCVRIAPDGRVDGVDLDLSPLSSPRARVSLAASSSIAPPLPPSLPQCIARVLDGLGWACRPNQEVAHVAVTMQLPRGLVERF